MTSLPSDGDYFFGISRAEWDNALSRVLGQPVTVTAIRPLSGNPVKTGGLSETLSVEYADRRGVKRACLAKRHDAAQLGETTVADQLQDGAWRLSGYGGWPRHARSLGLAVLRGHEAVSVLSAVPDSVISFEASLPGVPYGDILLDPARQTDEEAVSLARALCAFMVRGHGRLHEHVRATWRRSLRVSLVDSFLRTLETADDFWGARAGLRDELERLMLSWRRRLIGMESRLRLTHCDFHPWNVLVDGKRLAAIGRRMPGAGDPVNDVAAMAVNFLWLKFLKPAHAARYDALYRAWWDTWLKETDDAEAMRVAPPYFAVRCAVLVSPRWYAATPHDVRERIAYLLTQLLTEKWSVYDDAERF